MWDVRGGGLYACGFAVTFIVLEAGSFIEDFKEIGLLLDGQVVDFILNFIIDSLQNTVAGFHLAGEYRAGSATIRRHWIRVGILAVSDLRQKTHRAAGLADETEQGSMSLRSCKI